MDQIVEFTDPFDNAAYRALLDLGDSIHDLPSLYANWKHSRPHSRQHRKLVPAGAVTEMSTGVI